MTNGKIPIAPDVSITARSQAIGVILALIVAMSALIRFYNYLNPKVHNLFEKRHQRLKFERLAKEQQQRLGNTQETLALLLAKQKHYFSIDCDAQHDQVKVAINQRSSLTNEMKQDSELLLGVLITILPEYINASHTKRYEQSITFLSNGDVYNKAVKQFQQKLVIILNRFINGKTKEEAEQNLMHQQKIEKEQADTAEFLKRVEQSVQEKKLIASLNRRGYRAQKIEEIEEIRAQRKYNRGSSTNTVSHLSLSGETESKANVRSIRTKERKHGQALGTVARRKPGDGDNLPLVPVSPETIRIIVRSNEPVSAKFLSGTNNKQDVCHDDGDNVTTQPIPDQLVHCLHQLESCYGESIEDAEKYFGRLYYHFVCFIVNMFEYAKMGIKDVSKPFLIGSDQFKQLLSLRNAVVDHPEWYLLNKDGRQCLIDCQYLLHRIFPDYFLDAKTESSSSSDTPILLNYALFNPPFNKMICYQDKSPIFPVDDYLNNLQKFMRIFNEITGKGSKLSKRRDNRLFSSTANVTIGHLPDVTAAAGYLFAIGECIKCLTNNYMDDLRLVKKHYQYQRKEGFDAIESLAHHIKRELRDVLAHEVNQDEPTGIYYAPETLSAEHLWDKIRIAQRILGDGLLDEAITNTINASYHSGILFCQ